LRRLSLALLAAVNVALLALVTPTSVSADHNEDAFYNVSFPYDKNVFWSFQPGFPDDPKRGAVTNGFDQWDDKVEGRGPNFIKQADQNDGSPYEACNGPNSVSWRNDLQQHNIPVGVIAVTAWCVDNTTYVMEGFAQVYDSDPKFGDGSDADWHVGDGTVASRAVDMFGVSTHEVGHATGWGAFGAQDHFLQDAICDHSLANRQTMCAQVSPGSYPHPKAFRTREAHDGSVYTDAYTLG